MPYKLNVDLPAVNAGYDYAVLTGKTDIFPYEDGKKTFRCANWRKINPCTARRSSCSAYD